MSTTEAPPNIILIVADTLRRDHIGAYGNQAIRTPHLDRLADEAVVFDQQLVSSFPTVPARADLLTGRFSYTSLGWQPLPTELPTLPALLAQAGYLTTAIVDTPFYLRHGFGYDRGFDDFFWIPGQDMAPSQSQDSRRTWVRESDRCVVRTMTTAEEWLEQHYCDQFFLLVDTWDPHEPWDAPEYYTSLYLSDYDGREVFPCYRKYREAGLSEEDVRVAHATYCGEVTLVDRWIGHLLEKVDLLGLRENTYVVFLSDHGFYFGEHGYLGKAEWLEDFFRSEMTFADDADAPDWLVNRVSWLAYERSPLYQEVTRVPLMVRGPGLAPGRRQALTTLPDLAPTILNLAGIDAPSTMQGQSLRNVILGRRDEHRPFVISSWPLYFAEGTVTNAVDGRSRRVKGYMPLTVTTRDTSLIVGGPTEMPELYDLTIDPVEAVNLWEDDITRGTDLLRQAIRFLEGAGTAEHLIALRRGILVR